MLLQRKQANSFVPAIFFPHGMAFLEKRGGLVPVHVFIFPVKKGQGILHLNFCLSGQSALIGAPL